MTCSLSEMYTSQGKNISPSYSTEYIPDHAIRGKYFQQQQQQVAHIRTCRKASSVGCVVWMLPPTPPPPTQCGGSTSSRNFISTCITRSHASAPYLALFDRGGMVPFSLLLPPCSCSCSCPCPSCCCFCFRGADRASLKVSMHLSMKLKIQGYVQEWRGRAHKCGAVVLSTFHGYGAGAVKKE